MKEIKLNKHTIKTTFLLFCSLIMLYTSCKKEEKNEGATAVPTAIEQYYPNSGNAGTLVNIEGEGFGTDKSKISATIDGTAMNILSVQDDRIVVQVPEGGKSGLIRLKVND